MEFAYAIANRKIPIWHIRLAQVEYATQRPGLVLGAEKKAPDFSFLFLTPL